MCSTVIFLLFTVAAWATIALKKPEASDISARVLRFTTEYSLKDDDEGVQFEAFLKKTMQLTRKYKMYSKVLDKDEQMDHTKLRRKNFKDKETSHQIDTNYLGYY